MKKTFFKRIASPIQNEQGIAALITIVLAIIIIGSIAFNFVAETRQKQSGSILTYTSTNAMMIAEAGLRYTQKCLLEVDVTWGCPADIHDQSDWSTITPADITKSFGGDGSFTVTFPANGSNDSDNIFVISTGTFRGGQRSLSRFISRVCVLGEDAVTTCTGFSSKNNANIVPSSPPPVEGVCPDNPPGIVGPIDPAPVECDSCPSASCPNFKKSDHLLAGNILDPTFTRFCKFELKDNDVVNTNEADHITIVVKKDFKIKDNATLRLNQDAVDPLDGTKDTTINIYDDVELRNNGEIRVKGTLTLNVADKFDMKNSSRINNNQGEAANMSAWVEGNATIKNSALFVGALASDGKIELKNNAKVKGALFGNEVKLKNNATIIYEDNENAGANTTGYSQCTSGDVPPGWSE